MVTRIFLDCEWNDFKGELISIALVTDSDLEFYEVVEFKKPSEWVSKNVIPVLGKESISYSTMQDRLQKWLSQFDELHIVSDWPEDIKHFCDALIIGPGEMINVPNLCFTLIDGNINYKSEVPHNALADARAIKQFVLG